MFCSTCGSDIGDATICQECDSSTKRCPYCAETIKASAVKCRHCGSMLTRPAPPIQAVAVPNSSSNNNGIAAVLSLIIPGAGQMLKGHIGAGLGWLVGVVIGYMLLIVPGLILHVVCIIDAYNKPQV
jgi:TM2 domain-containing membrane protein YozV